MGDHSDMIPLGNRLAREGYRVLIPDLPFHGKSIRSRPRDLQEASSFIMEALLDTLGIGQDSQTSIAVAGYSLGGRIAMQIATELSRPSSRSFSLRGLILISSAPPPRDETERGEREQAGIKNGSKMKAMDVSKQVFRDWLLSSWYSSPMWGHIQEADGFNEMVAYRVKNFDNHAKLAWAEAAVSLARYSNIRHAVLDVCSLYIHGEDDEKYASFSTRMAELSTNLWIDVSKGSGHHVLLQKPRETEESLVRFLREDAGYSSSKKPLRICKARVLRYSLPLKNPMSVSASTVHRREGVLLALSSTDDVFTGVGDICPLPGLHIQSLDTCLREAENFASVLISNPSMLGQTCCILHEINSLSQNMSPATKNGVTCAILHVLSAAEHISLVALVGFMLELSGTNSCFPVNRTRTIRLNGVLPRGVLHTSPKRDTSRTHWKNKIANFIEVSPFQTLKVKVGVSHDVREEGTCIEAAVHEAVRLGRTMRLDANRAWSREEFNTLRLCLGTMSRNIEFIEEPLKERGELKEYLLNLDTDLRICVGLDESISDCSLSEVSLLARSPNCGALVVKPAVIGALCDIFDICAVASMSNCRVVLSSVFDSGVGLAWAAVLAAVCQTMETSHGLGTFAHLSKDVITPGFRDVCVFESDRLSINKCTEFLDVAADHVVMTGKHVFTWRNQSCQDGR